MSDDFFRLTEVGSLQPTNIMFKVELVIKHTHKEHGLNYIIVHEIL